MSKLREINENEFEEIVNDNSLVFVDFYATWCPPCKMLGPVLDDVNEEMGDKITMVKINVDENENISRQFGIINIPTMIIFKNGEPVGKMVGYRDYEQVVEEIEKYLD
ncbi:MAG: thioredoxin [Clostridia bacterium]|nr:thioredoxin [Clostridia bacterium]